VGLDWILPVLIPATGLMIGSYLHTMRIYRRFKAIGADKGLTGAQIARALLDRNGLSDIAVTEGAGRLSDRYDIKDRSISLSRENYRSTSIAAIGIAAHETGHALQAHDVGRTSLRIAICLMQLAGWGAVLAFSLFFIGLLSGWSDMVLIGMVVFLGAAGCSLLTLPVEMNASHRALAQLGSGEFLTDQELLGARSVLRAAAWSYVAVTGTALIQAVRDLIRRDDDSP